MIKKVSIWQYHEYKLYLRAVIEENHQITGFKSKLAQGAGCQRSFLSQALNGSVQLTLDHAAQLSEYLHLSSAEQDYFLEMVSFARAGSSALQRISKNRMKQLKRQSKQLSERLNLESLSEVEARAVYYSSWHFAAVHTSLSLPELNTAKKIAARLSLDAELVQQALRELEKMGLAKSRGKSWKLASKSIHLPKDSPYSVVNQFNWRQKAIQKLQGLEKDGVHYSGLYALRTEDREKIHQLLLESIERAHSIVAASECEKLVVLNCDFFEL